MRPMLRQPSAVVKLIAFINVVWLLVLLSLEIILVYEWDDKGLRDIIPSLKGSPGHEYYSHPNKTSYKQCTYHIYRKYACVQVAITDSRLPPASSDSLLPLIWFSVCCLDILISFVLYRAAEQKRRRLAFIWLCTAVGILLFQIIILAMYSFASLSIWHELPLIGFCAFRIYSLFVVYKFWKTLVNNEQDTNPNDSANNRNHKRNDDSVEVSTTSSTTERSEPEAKNQTSKAKASSNKQQQNTNGNYCRNGSVNTRSQNQSHSVSLNDELMSCSPAAAPGAPGLKIRKLSQVKMVDPLPVLIFK